jgi:2-oxoisovalerate dehydrogenase E1 component alpha subunit
VRLFERQLVRDGVIHRELVEMIWQDAREEADAAAVVATAEPMPTPDDVERFTYAPSRVDAVYPDDYTGLPR